jgi:hypothetical protein
VLCPDAAAAGWHTVLATEFTAGLHSFDVLLGPGAVVHRVRLERKKDANLDYLATTKRLGLDLGEDGALTRDQAGEAWRWVAAHRIPKEQQCGEVVIPQTLIASNANDAGAAALPPSFVVPPQVPPAPPPPYPNPVPPLSPIDLVP